MEGERMVNKRNIDKLIAVMDDDVDDSEWIGMTEQRNDEFSFDMTMFMSDCMTAGCIAGTIVYFFYDGPEDLEYLVAHYEEVDAYATKFLGLNERQSGELFSLNNTNLRLEDVKVDDAIKALEILRDTGEVNWDFVDPYFELAHEHALREEQEELANA